MDNCGDVCNDTAMLTQGSLFTGYGGLDMAVDHVFGSRTVWTSDIDKGACKVIAHRYPGVPNHGDITAIDWSAVEPVDILSGGSPCQDLSTAGRRAGMTEGTRSNLWAAMRGGINELRPRYVVWENVQGALSASAASDLGWTTGRVDERAGDQRPAKEDPALRALGRVLGDLAELGYDAQWCGLRASDVGAPHHRFRVFLLAADASGGGVEGVRTEGFAVTDPPPEAGVPRCDGHRGGFGQYEPAVRRWERVTGHPAPASTDERGRLAARFPEWMMGLPPGWISDVPGITRTEALRLAGNGVVPQQAVAALTSLVPLAELV